MGQYRISRNTEASIIQFLETELSSSWSNVSVIKTYAELDKIGLSPGKAIVMVRCGDTIHTKAELGSGSTIREIHVLIDLFCTNDGQRLDLKDFLIKKLKHGIPYYEYTIAAGAIQSKTLNGRLTTLEMDESVLNFDTDKNELEIQDRYRHLITLRLNRGKIEV